jgi:hypothetical protein
MMTIKHTLAPWLLTFGEHDAAIHAGATIAMVDDTMGGWKANAFLIAAAPDLLRLLIDIEAHLYTGAALHPGSLIFKEDAPAHDVIVSAIAKATRGGA